MGKRKRGGKKGKKKTHNKGVAPDERKKVEQSFVMKRGNIGKTLQSLLADTRRVMLPNTALHLRERKSNTLKDFLHVAGPLGVTHFIIFSATDVGSYLRVARVPHGPTLTFRISSYTLVKDIVSLQQNPHSPASEFKHSPLLVLNNFKGPGEHVKLMSVIFQKMFPAINIKKMRVEDCRRVVLFDYDPETNAVQFRHYLITSHPVGVSKSVKRILQKKLPDLSQLKDISQYVLRNAKASESDMEDGDDTHVEVERQIKKKRRIKKVYKTQTKVKVQQSAVRLHELGPRLTLSLIKIQEGFCDGQVLYHQFVTKTAEEEAALEERKERERELKERRRQQQMINLAKKGKLPPGMEAPGLKTEDDGESEVKEEAEEEAEEAELDDEDEDEEPGQEGDDEDRDYGSEGEEDAEIETLSKKKKSKKPNKRRKVEAEEVKEEESVEDQGQDEEAEVKEEEAPQEMEEEQPKKGKKAAGKGKQTPKFSMRMPVSKPLKQELSSGKKKGGRNRPSGSRKA